MNSQEVGARLGLTMRYVQQLTRSAQQQAQSTISYRGQRFGFTVTSAANTRGKAYTYTPIDPPAQAGAAAGPDKPRRRRPTAAALTPQSLPPIANLSRPTPDEKQAIVTFCAQSRLSYGAIARALICQHAAFHMQVPSLTRRLKRWVAAYQSGGRAALADRRGRRAAQVNMARVKRVIYACGTKHYTSQYFYYCYLWAKAEGKTVDLRAPRADIHYTTFVRAAQKLTREDPHISEYLRIGLDAFTYAEPSVGRDWWYANQQWEIDATRQDILVKVPILPTGKHSGRRDYCRREAADHYQQARMQIIGIIDNCTGATVYGLYSSSNYYGNARLLYKAVQRLGRPEQIKGDQGADFVSRDFQKLLHEQGIPYIAANKGRGDQKGAIERSFKTLQHSREFESLAGFIGHGVDQRQHLENEASTRLSRLSGVATHIQGDVMWWWEFENWLDNYLAHTQADRYARHTPATESDLAGLYRQLGKRRFCKVSKNGLYHQRRHYFSAELWRHVRIGEPVEIIEHIDNSRRLFVYRDGQYLCEVMEKGEYRAGVSIEEVKQVKRDYKQRVVQSDRALARRAQREYRGFQNAMRDEFIDLEAHNAKLKQAQEAGDGFDALAELRRYALGGAE